LNLAEKKFRKTKAAEDQHQRTRSLNELQDDVEGLKYMLGEIKKSVDTASRNPNRFKLTNVEIQGRRQWMDDTGQRVELLRSQVWQLARVNGVSTHSSVTIGARENRTTVTGIADVAAGAGTGPSTSGKTRRPDSAGRKANSMAPDSFVTSETRQQQQMMHNQDEELDVLGEHVLRIGELGKEMGQELDAQGELLDEFGYEMMGTQTRLAAAQRKVQHVLDRAGTKGQLVIIAVLVVVLVVLLLMVIG
jgi:SYP6 family syntaxin